MASSAISDPFIKCLDDLSKLINIRSRFYLRDRLKLKSKYKFIDKLKDALDLLINKKSQEMTHCAPADMPIDLTIRLGTLKRMLHLQDHANPEINNLYGRSLFQVAAHLKEIPRPMTVEHMWQVAEICRLCDVMRMEGFEVKLGKRYWKAFRSMLEDQLGGMEVRMSGVSGTAYVEMS